MTQYHTVKRIDNSRLVRPAPPARLHEFWRRVAAGAGLAACLLVYAWQHFECIQLRYQVEQLEASRAQATLLNQQLHLEADALSSLRRVDGIARRELGLTVSVPGLAGAGEAFGEPVLAQARGAAQPPRP
ncbi:MAG TPA: hypothetical protein VEG64_09455 [Candidatus Sulfotelmatobacter sp.]|nr:hypothetical protein [Candidatus Sulfotelmatobacter sp.]